MRVLGLSFTNPVGTVGVLDVCLYLGRGIGPGSGGVGWCYVCLSCESGFSVYMSGPGICILCFGAPSVRSCCTLWISASYSVFCFMADIANRDLVLSRHHSLVGCVVWSHH